MRIETTTRVKPGEIGVRCNRGGENGPFVTIDFDLYSYIRLTDMDDCDRLIRAAVTAKRRLEAAIARTPHPFEPDSAYHCERCGLLQADELHAEREQPGLYAAAIQQTEYFAQPGNTIADLLAEQAAS